MGPLDQLVGQSAAIVAVREQVTRLLRSTSAAGRVPPVLVLGETGTGKGLLAGAIHRAGPRASGPFVDINCAAIPEALLEAELFGFERGAFTDARQAKAGLFQTAHGGTIFLDEIGLMPASVQSKLLKVIEERSVRRLGSTRSEAVDVCVIAATSEDLAAAVQARRFRPDLYHRLAVVTLVLPPLRARGRDVVLLAEHLLTRICEEYGLRERALTEAAQRALLTHAWPGNVRELMNALERAVLLTDDPRLSPVHLALPEVESSAPAPSGAGDEDERRRLLEVLQAVNWNFTRAAARLGVPRNTLRYRTERLGIEPAGPPARRRGGRPPVAGREVRPSVPAPTETRRVTILLVRLLPPVHAEVWDARRALEATAEKVRAFGGQVWSAVDGTVRAAFGLVPDEDTPWRAANAALAVQALAARSRSEGGVGADVMVAIHTASLAVTRDRGLPALTGEAREAAGTALERLLEVAVRGMVIASAPACRFLARRFELSPVESPAASAAGACRIVRHAERGRTRFVGREAELRILHGRFERASAGQGQVVTIVGEPGIGKSRLLHEFHRRLGRAATWIEGHALAFGQATPFHPVIDMLRRTYHIDDADSPASIGDKIERGVRRLGADLGWVLPFVRYVLSVDPGDPAVVAMDPRRRHAAIVRATHLLLERGAEMRPHVIVLEDVHWADPATEDWLARLAEAVATRRVLLITTSRPGGRSRFGDRSFHTGLAMATLSAEESASIARTLLQVEDLPAALQRLVVDKAEGNPFFLEELTRSLQEQGLVRQEGNRLVVATALDAVPVPDTVEEVILARMDRLDPELRGLLQVASVIGRTVPFPLLKAVAGRGEEALAEQLARLQAGEFVHETRAFPDIEHAFKHALTQDVAYGSLTSDARRALHSRIVQAIEELYPDRIREHVERLAYHAVRGEQWVSAVRYFRAAGAKAFDRSANREAVLSLEHALAALTHMPEDSERLEQAIDIRLALRSALLQLGEIGRIAEYLREAEALATTLGDRPRLAWVWTYATIASLFAGDPARAVVVGERACRLADEVGDPGLRATARTPWGHALRERGDLRRAVTLFREAIDALGGELIHERLGQAMPPSLFARNMAAVCLADLGDFEEAARLGQEAVELAQRLDLPFGLALAYIALGYTRLVESKAEEARRALDLGIEVIQQRDLPTWFPWAAAARGYALALCGQPAEGGRLLDEALRRAVALPFLFGHSQWVAWRAHAYLLEGQAEAAARTAQDALRLSQERGERGYEAWALVIAAEIERRRGPGARAAAMAEQALALATELGMRPLAARCKALVGAPVPRA